MSAEDMLDLRDSDGYVEVFPISSRGLVATLQSATSNVTTNGVWPPKDSDHPQFFVAYPSAGITNGSREYEPLVGSPSGQHAYTYYDGNNQLLGGSRNLGTWGATDQPDWELYHPIVMFDMAGLPDAPVTKVELIVNMAHGIFDWDGFPDPKGFITAVYQDTYHTYDAGEGEAFTDEDAISDLPETTVFEPIDVTTLPDQNTAYGALVLELENDGGFETGGLRGLQFFLDVFRPPARESEDDVPAKQGTYLIQSDYHYYDANVGELGLEAARYLPYLRIYMGQIELLAQVSMGGLTPRGRMAREPVEPRVTARTTLHAARRFRDAHR